MKQRFQILAGSVALACGIAHAGVITTGGVNAGADGQRSAIGTCNVSFNAGTTANTCGATYQGTTGGNFVTGSLLNKYAAPVGDTTTYLAVGPSSGSSTVSISLASNQNYFGFFTGSLDSFNVVQFFLNNVMVDSFTGSDINAVAFPGTQADGNRARSVYVNYFTTTGSTQIFYNRIVYSSSGDAFETDNHSFGVASVPEPSSLALMGLAGIALFAAGIRRRA